MVAACTVVEMLFTPLLIFSVRKSSMKDTTTAAITLSKAEPYGFYKSAVNLQPKAVGQQIKRQGAVKSV